MTFFRIGKQTGFYSFSTDAGTGSRLGFTNVTKSKVKKSHNAALNSEIE
jgi:hypothetical protein